MRIIALIFAVLFSVVANAQELNCQVSVLSPQVQTTNKAIYDKLQTDLRDFLNTRKWTNDEFLNQERIECSMVITVSENSNDDFKANIQIQSRRPVYHSSFNTPMFNHKDDDFMFSYLQDQLIEFDESNVTSNLSAVIAFYAYIIIGLDYDSYSPEGGTPYFIKAQTIVNNAQSLREPGWRSFEDRNRYWLAENLLNVQCKPLRKFIYSYHRQGFDKFADNITDARADITNSLPELKKMYQERPNAFITQIFFFTKSDELINLYTQATNDEKNRAIAVFTLVDPPNTLKYQALTSGQK